MSQFGGLWQHTQKQLRVLVGLGSAALAAAVALSKYGSPKFPERNNKV